MPRRIGCSRLKRNLSSGNLVLLSTISIEEWAALVESDGWVPELDLVERVDEIWRRHRRFMTDDWDSEVLDAIPRNVREAQITTGARVRDELFSEFADYHELAEEEHDFIGSAMRVSRGRVYRMRPAMRDGTAACLGLIIAFLSAPIGSLLFFVAGGQVALGLRLKQYYEQLEGDELRVFETIADLAGRASIRNYDKLRDKDYKAAYGLVNPTAIEIHSEVGLSHEEVLRTLTELKRRGIVAERRGRWGITF